MNLKQSQDSGLLLTPEQTTQIVNAAKDAMAARRALSQMLGRLESITSETRDAHRELSQKLIHLEDALAHVGLVESGLTLQTHG